MSEPTPNPAPSPTVEASSVPLSTTSRFETLGLVPSDAPAVPNCIGEYVVLGELGRGGMGVVYRAEDSRLKREVALKVMLPQFAANPQAKARFVREARAQAKVEHDHVAAIFTVSDHAGLPYLVMPLLKGMTLQAALKANPRPPLNEVIRIGREVAEGLAAAHEKGLVHRDIKPANIWLEGKKLRVKVLDFGLARIADADAESEDGPVTREGAVIGTPSYMSPEQGQGGAVDVRTDLWSLGVILYQMTTGELPFRGPNTMAILTALAINNPPPPIAINPYVPPGLSEVVMRLLSKDPAFRPQTAEQLVEELRALEASLVNAVRVVPLDAQPPLVVPLSGPDPFAEIDATEANPSEATQTAASESKPSSGYAVWAVVAGVLLTVVTIVAVVIAKVDKKVSPDVANGDEPTPPPRKPDNPPKVTPQPKEKVPVPGRIDLLALIDPALDKVKGTWERSGSGLVGHAKGGHAVIEAPYQPPEEYDYLVDFTRTEGSTDVSLTLSRVGRSFSFCLGQNGDNFGFGLVKGAPKFVPGSPLVNGRRYFAKIEVRRDRVAGYLDGNKLQELQTDGSDLSMFPGTLARDEKLLGLSLYSAAATFHRVEVAEVTGKGRFTRGDLDRQAAEALLMDKNAYVNVRVGGQNRSLGGPGSKTRQVPDEPFELVSLGWYGNTPRPKDYASRFILPNVAGLKAFYSLEDGSLTIRWTEEEFLQFATNPFWVGMTKVSTGVELTPKIVAALKRCSKISSLHCFGSDVDDDQLAEIASLPLTQLYLENLGQSGKVTAQGWEHLGRSKVTLVMLINPTTLDTEAMRQFTRMTNLTELNLMRATISDDAMRELGKGKKLTWFSLSRSNFPESSLSHLTDLQELRRFGLHNTSVTDAALKHIGMLKRLEVLQLSDTLVTDEGLEHLKDLPRLTRLDLERTRVTQTGAQKLAESLPNCRISHSTPGGGSRVIDPKKP